VLLMVVGRLDNRVVGDGTVDAVGPSNIMVGRSEGAIVVDDGGVIADGDDDDSLGDDKCEGVADGLVEGIVELGIKDGTIMIITDGIMLNG